MIGRDPVLAQRSFQFIHADVFLGHVGFNDLAVVNQEGGLPLDEFPKAAVDAGQVGNEVIQ